MRFLPSLHACLLLLPAYAAIALLVYWWFIDHLEIAGGPWIRYDEVTLAADEYQAGSHVTPYWRYEVLRDCPRRIEVWASNHIDTLISSHFGHTSGTGIGKREVVRRIRLPKDLHPGEYVIRVISEGRCNPLRSQVVTVESPPFQVVK